VPKVLDWHNVLSVIEERHVRRTGGLRNAAGARHELWRTRRSEKQMAKQFEHSVAVSEKDAAAIRQLYGEAEVTVVPNGVDCRYFSNDDPETFEPQTLVFTGTMDYEPNEAGILYFVEKVLPHIERQIDSVRLYVVGQRPSAKVTALAKQSPGKVIVTGYVDDVRPYLARAAVCIVPLLNGGGTRLKILEALAMQRPVVSTSVGAEGLALVHGQEILIADKPDDFASAVKMLLEDSTLRKRQMVNGLARVRTEYDWSVIGGRLRSVWEETVASTE
jgi:glycosyltransferase involved in cell wall biosynthesis